MPSKEDIYDSVLHENFSFYSSLNDYRLSTKNMETPNELKHLMTEDDFNSILNFAIDHLTQKRYKNISLVENILFYDAFDESEASIQINFLNLVKSILCEEQQDWQIKTVEYLEMLNQDQKLENEVILNFEKAKEYLTVRLQSAANYESEPYKDYLERLIYKVDVPETYSSLALDLPSRFLNLTIDKISTWGVDEMTLFEIAHNNLLDKIENIEVKEHDWEGVILYTLFDRYYSAAYCIDFANNCDGLIGETGSLISFPTEGSVFVHPISNKKQFKVAYDFIVEKTNVFFDDDPSPISRNIYWFYENKFILFETTLDDGYLNYNIPQQLYNLLSK